MKFQIDLPIARLSEKLYCNWIIVLVTMVTPISSHVKDKDSIFTVHAENMIFLVKGKILVFHQHLYNNTKLCNSNKTSLTLKMHRLMITNFSLNFETVEQYNTKAV